MRTFADYRQMRELAELSVRHDIDLEPLVQLSERLLLDTDLAPEEVYREFLQQAANIVGNLAGKAVTGIGNIGKGFAQGWRQGRGFQPQSSGPQIPSGNPNLGKQEQNPYNAADENEGPLLTALTQLQNLKQNIEKLASKGSNTTPDFTIQYLDRISQIIKQVVVNRYGGLRLYTSPDMKKMHPLLQGL